MKCLRPLFLLSLVMLLTFSIFAPSANAGLFGRCGGGGLFGRRASACNQQSYSYQYQTAAPCGQAAVGYSYQYQSTAPCTPCGQTAAPIPTYVPSVPVPNAPALNSAPISSYHSLYRAAPARPPQVTCQNGKCYLRR